jgi:hypothetical protein
MNATSFTAIVVALQLLAACGQPTSNSRMVGLASQMSPVYVNPASLRVTPEGTIVRMEIIMSSQAIAKEEQGLPGINANVAQHFVVKFDCGRRKYVFLDRTWRFKDGGTQNFGAGAGGDVMPNSPIEMAMDYACRPAWRLWIENNIGS